MFGRLWAIALNTFREAVRIRILYGVLVLVVGANLFAIFLGEMSVDHSARVARDVGLAGISLFGAFTAIYLGVALLYAEIQRRTVHSIVSKPIERWEFVLGKYLGMVLTLTALVALFSVAMLGLLVWQDIAINAGVVKAIILAWFEVMTVAAIAVFFSSFSTPFLSGMFAFGLFAVGRLTPDMQDALKGSEAAPWARSVMRITLEVVPDLHLFSVSGRTIDGAQVSVHGGFVSWAYVGTAAGYGLLWIAGLLLLASLIFQRRDFA
jgi:ABC-type transport system involved in multi-copper enzyme maturation permease subunit